MCVCCMKQYAFQILTLRDNVLNIKIVCENVYWNWPRLLYIFNVELSDSIISDAITRYITQASPRKYVCSLNTQNHQKHLCSAVIMILVLEVLILLPQSPFNCLLQLQNIFLFCNMRKHV
jgi:hypothetical protein